MSIGNAVLSVLGLSPYVQEAEAIVTASKTAIDLIKSTKELLDSDAGKKFRDHIETLVSVSHQKPDGSVHIGDAPHVLPQAVRPVMVWAWVGGLEGWRLVPHDDAVRNGWQIYGSGE
jgi:hypothetical protein